MTELLACDVWLWTYKDPKTGQWVEDNHRYMAHEEAQEYFQSIDENIQFMILPYAPKRVLVPIVNGTTEWLKAKIVEPESRPAPKTT